MSSENFPPDKIWIITEEILETSIKNEIPTPRGARGSDDTGGLLGAETNEEKIGFNTPKGKLVITRHAVEVSKLKEEMRSFLQAMREMFDEAEAPTPNSKMQLDEVDLSVEINGEGKISLFGIGGTKAGGKGAMTFKFKRK